MHYDEKIYRPPTEAYTLLLQVTSGCSHNKCIFCNMYEGVKFKVSPIEEIIQDLSEIKLKAPNTKRIYLLNGDPFSLSFEKLKEIAILIKEYLPLIEVITMYASINSVKNKSVEELRILRELGINELYFGIETGFDEALENINKGNSSFDAIEQLLKLNNAKMDFYSIIMYGVAGENLGVTNAICTANLLNKVKTLGIGLMNLSVMEGTKLYDRVQEGSFIEASDLEKVKEIRAFIQELEVKSETFLTCIHISNLLSLEGNLPYDKDKFLKQLDEAIKAIIEGKKELNKRDFFGKNI
ncbi:MAG: radical SAM protein [Lachnospirales bacterium]